MSFNTIHPITNQLQNLPQNLLLQFFGWLIFIFAFSKSSASWSKAVETWRDWCFNQIHHHHWSQSHHPHDLRFLSLPPPVQTYWFCRGGFWIYSSMLSLRQKLKIKTSWVCPIRWIRPMLLNLHWVPGQVIVDNWVGKLILRPSPPVSDASRQRHYLGKRHGSIFLF